MFRQMIPEGGFKQDENQKKSTTFKSLKTADLKVQREEEIIEMDDSAQYIRSKNQLYQFSQIKRILINLTFKDRGKQILSTEIIQHILDEMRCERKIVMVLLDIKIDEYIKQDISELDLNDKETWKDQDMAVQLNIMDKLIFREQLA